MLEPKKFQAELITNVTKNNRYFESLKKAVFEFLDEEMRACACTDNRLMTKIKSARDLFSDEIKPGQELYGRLNSKKVNSTIGEIPEAEIQGDKLILYGKHEYNIKGIQDIIECDSPASFAERVEDVILSISQLSVFILNSGDIDQESKDNAGSYFPSPEDIYTLKCLARGLRAI